jgi:hypothetical protein
MRSDKILKIVYPPGGGGHWLSNLIHNLETAKFEHTTPTNNIFDYTTETKSIIVRHYFDFMPEKKIEDKNISNLDVKTFATDKIFNAYIIKMYKTALNADTRFDSTTTSIAHLSLNDQFHSLTDKATFLLTDNFHRDTYFNNIDLDYSLIFTDPDQFINLIFALLTKYSINYTANREYCHLAIQNYQNTCTDPLLVFDNTDNLVWLAWCHAVAQINNIAFDCDFTTMTTTAELADALSSVNELVKSLTHPMMFTWNKQ